jgi:hypothetical protein
MHELLSLLMLLILVPAAIILIEIIIECIEDAKEGEDENM